MIEAPFSALRRPSRECLRNGFKSCARAFAETLRDSEFLADAKKSNLVIDPVLGSEIEKIAVEICSNLNRRTINKFNEILK